MKCEEYGTLVQDTDSIKLKYLETNVSQGQLVHHRLTWDGTQASALRERSLTA